MSQFDVKMTALADEIKAKNTTVTGKLSIDEMITAVQGIQVGTALPTGITVQPENVLDGVYYIDANGTKQEGSMPNRGAIVAISDTVERSLPGGYYEEIVVPGNIFANLSAGDIDVATDDASKVLNSEYFITSLGELSQGTMPDHGIVEVELTDSVQVLPEGRYAQITIPAAPQSSGDSVVQFGYWTADGKFQEVDLSGDAPTDSGEAVTVDAVTFKTGKDAPDYGSGGGIDFYECASYTPEADAYTKYFFAISGAADTGTNGTYTRTKWVESPDTDNFTTNAKWEQDSGYYLEEQSGYGEFYYYIKDSTGSTKYQTEMLTKRVTDYSQLEWQDSGYNSATMTFSAIQTEEIPATTEGWSGYKMTQNSETGAWQKSETLTENLQVGYFKPKVGEIYSADTSIRVRKMFDGAVYPITSDGLVFYAPLQTDYVDMVSGKVATVTDGTFAEYNGLRCLKLDGSGYVKWPDNSDLPSGTSAASVVLLVAPINQSDWRAYMSVGQEGEGHLNIAAKNGHFREWGGDRIQVNEWQSLIVTRDDNASGKAYLNGKLNGSGSDNANPPMPSCVCVGSNMNEGYTQKANSYVAFAAVYNRELSADEVQEIHNALMEDVEQ